MSTTGQATEPATAPEPATATGQAVASGVPNEPATAPGPAIPTQAGPGPAVATAPAGRPRRRWPRVAVPFAVALLVLILTVVTHALQQPDPAALTPAQTGPDGGSRLAGLLAAKGIGIETVHRSQDALASAFQGSATLLVPAPALMNPVYLRALGLLPASTRIVLLAPGGYTLASGHIPVSGAGTRWATKAVEPGCALPEARGAGKAAVYRVHYLPSPGQASLRCYHDSLLRLRLNRAELVIVGASDPFRNDRIGEYGNAALATGLLSQYPRLIWLDLHGNEAAPPGGGTGPFGGAGGSGSAGGHGGGNQRDGGDPGGSAHRSSSGDSPPLPIPAQFWAVLALLVAAMLAIALAKARRLGPPIAEPLPVTVRGLETVTGRGRLYQRAKARGWALHILRTAAIRRLAAALDLGPDPAPAAVVDALARRTGRAADEIDAILYGAQPRTDAELVDATNELDALMHQALPDIARGESG